MLDHLQSYIDDTAQGIITTINPACRNWWGKNKQNVCYRIIKESGPAHAKVFEAGVYYKDRLLAAGQGRSKKEAEQNAAEKVLKNRQLLCSLGLKSPHET